METLLIIKLNSVPFSTAHDCCLVGLEEKLLMRKIKSVKEDKEVSFVFVFASVVKYVYICNPVLPGWFVTLIPFDEQLLKYSIVICLFFLKVFCFPSKAELVAEYRTSEAGLKCETLGAGGNLGDHLMNITFFFFQRENLPKRLPGRLSLGTLSCYKTSLTTHPYMPEAMCKCPVGPPAKPSLAPSPAMCQTLSELS